MEKFLKEINEKHPEILIDGEVDLKKLMLILYEEFCDIQDQLKEKDYQILRINEKLDKLV